MRYQKIGEGAKYIGLTVNWDYERGEGYLSMPGYVTKALQQFQHEPPKKRQGFPVFTDSAKLWSKKAICRRGR